MRRCYRYAEIETGQVIEMLATHKPDNQQGLIYLGCTSFDGPPVPPSKQKRLRDRFSKYRKPKDPPEPVEIEKEKELTDDWHNYTPEIVRRRIDEIERDESPFMNYLKDDE